MRPAQVARPDVARQPEVRGVGVPDRIVEESNSWMRGPKISSHAALMDVGDGLHEIAVRPSFRRRAAAPTGDARPVLHCRFDVTNDICEMTRRDERPHVGRLIHRVAHGIITNASWMERGRNRRVPAKQTSPWRHLAHHAIRRLIQIGVLTNDDGTLAAQLRQHGRDVRGGEPQNLDRPRCRR